MDARASDGAGRNYSSMCNRTALLHRKKHDELPQVAHGRRQIHNAGGEFLVLVLATLDADRIAERDSIVMELRVSK